MKRLFQIFAIAALALGITACDEQSEGIESGEVNITLTGDKNEIVADGIDAVVFTALVNGEAKSDIQIINLKNNTFVKNDTFTTTEAGDYLFKAVYGNKSSDAFKVTATAPEVPTLILEADKESIVANGTDVVTFTVTLDGVDVTAESTIMNGMFDEALEGATFSTDAIGEYQFYALYGEYESNTFVVEAYADQPVQKSLTITASKMRIKADGEDKVVFTAKYGEEDVTASCTLHTTTGAAIEGNEFTTTTAGTYNIYALYDNTRSNTLSIDAYDPAVVGKYDIGTVCEVNGTKGVVYAIKTDNQGNTWAYAVSLDEDWLQWSTENVWCNCNTSKGAWNTYDPFDERYSKADGGVRDIANYPAFAWCMEHGADWFLPSADELKWLWDAASGGTHKFDCEAMVAFNKILTDNGGTALQEDYYWSSNETSPDMIELIAFMDNSVVCLEPYKTKRYQTRAVTRIML